MLLVKKWLGLLGSLGFAWVLSLSCTVDWSGCETGLTLFSRFLLDWASQPYVTALLQLHLLQKPGFRPGNAAGASAAPAGQPADG
jgi:hypothetical protein